MTEPAHTSHRQSFSLGAAALMAMVLIVYIPVIRTAGFIWDDPQYILDNYTLRTLAGLAAIWIHPLSLPQYYPFVHTTFWIEYHLVGIQPTLYHVDNILLHAAAAILLWRALRRLEIPAAWLAAALFALHPIQVESVAWATERKNVLSAVFYLLSFHAYLNFAGNDFRTGPIRKKDYLLSLAFFIAALLSKSVACSLPAAILLLVYWRHGRLRWSDLRPLIPFFILGLVMASVTGAIESRHVGASGPEWNWTFLDRCLIAGRAFWFYVGKILWPHPLVFIYPRWQRMTFLQHSSLIAFPLAAIALLAGLWLLRRRIGRGPLVAFLFFAGTLLPALGFINLYPMRYSFVADHFQYHASIGLFVLAAVALRRLFGRFTPIPAVAVLAVLATLTWRQGYLYKNQRVLWEDVTAKNPNSWMAWGDLGDEYADLANDTTLPPGQRAAYRQKARACYVRLYGLAPEQPLTHLKWGLVEEYDGHLESARQEFAQSLALAPQFTVAMDSMGTLLIRLHQPDQAMKYFRQAISLDPAYAEARLHYGQALESAGDLAGALEQYSAAVSHHPEKADAQFELANLLMTREHRPDVALPHYAAAAADAPARADIHTNFAVALRSLGLLDQSRDQCRQALQLDPNLPQARQLWLVLTAN